MFGRRHEQELADIRVLTEELDRNARSTLARVESLREAQDRLAEERVPPLVAFVHIPKTAGGTVTAMLADAYSVDAIGKTGNYLSSTERTEMKVIRRAGAGWELWQRKGGRVAVGHTPYAVFRSGLPPDTRYMTFLREPVDRVVSHYHRHIRRRNPRHEGSPKDLASGRPRANSLEEALVEKRLAALTNLSTRFLCDDPSPSREMTDAALDEAKANLRGFAFVGIQERFEESIALLQRKLGWELGRQPESQDRHVSSDRPSVADLAEAERALIEECNQLDAELYRFALELFEAGG
jgi:hypothetical protein